MTYLLILIGYSVLMIALGAIVAAADAIRDDRFAPAPGTPTYDEVAGLP